MLSDSDLHPGHCARVDGCRPVHDTVCKFMQMEKLRSRHYAVSGACGRPAAFYAASQVRVVSQQRVQCRAPAVAYCADSRLAALPRRSQIAVAARCAFRPSYTPAVHYRFPYGVLLCILDVALFCWKDAGGADMSTRHHSRLDDRVWDGAWAGQRLFKDIAKPA